MEIAGLDLNALVALRDALHRSFRAKRRKPQNA